MSLFLRPVTYAYAVLGLLLCLTLYYIVDATGRFEATSGSIRVGYLLSASEAIAQVIDPSLMTGDRQAELLARSGPLSQQPGDRVRIRIYGAEGALLMDTDPAGDPSGLPRPEEVRQALDGARVRSEALKPGGIRWIYMTVPIMRDTKIIGAVSAGRSNRAIRSALDEIEEGYVLVGLAFVVLALLVMGTLFLYFIRPLELWLAYSTRFSQGHLPARPNLRRTRLGWLGALVDQLFDALSDRRYIETMMHCLAHELKTPIAGIKTAADYLQRTVTTGREQQQARNIVATVDRMHRTIEGVMALAALEKRNRLKTLKPVKAAVLFDELERRYCATLEAKGLTLRCKGASSQTVYCDETLLLQAVGNLLQNSINHSAAGQVIEFEIACGAKTVELSVRDYGTGIPEEALAHVFEKFYTLRGPSMGGKGTGLGLSFVQEVADLHFGTVSLSNAEGGGVRAILRLRRYGAP